MKKVNKRGFVLAETIAISVVVISALVIIYTQFINLDNSYYKSFKYNNVDKLYLTNQLKDFIYNAENNTIYNSINDENLYVDITDCSSVDFIEYTYCRSLIDAIDAKKVIITKNDITSLISNLKDYDFSENLKNYIKNSKSKEEGYRIIVEYKDTSIVGLVVSTGSMDTSSTCEYEIGTTWEYTYKGYGETLTIPCDGTYKIELYGAQGGGSDLCPADGYGAYTAGNIELTKNNILNIYVGQNNNTQGEASYNGGGIGYESNNSASYAATGAFSGGGATDVRINGTTVYDRIMVAAAGSGRSTSGNTLVCGGNQGGAAGGGLLGYYNTISFYTGTSQTNTNTCKYSEYCNLGSFGQGASSVANNHSNGGGGGGYWGGSADTSPYKSGSSGLRNGGSGSSYISGHTGCVAIQSSGSTTPKSGCTTGTTDNSCSIHYSGLYFTNTVMIDGYGYNWTNVVGTEVIGMPSHDGLSTITGNSGNGYAKITLVSLD